MADTSVFSIDNKIKVDDLWKGIAGHFDSLGQIINEFVDNAISNFEANATLTRSIIITLEELNDKSVKVSIEDSGTGIKNLNAAFSMGSHAGAETPLNEHGFGIKHALASGNRNNDNWVICTRLSENLKENTFMKIEAPYKLDNFQGVITDESWPGVLNGTGTLIQFTCAREMFNTIAQGIRGGVNKFTTVCDILCEDLGFIYAGIIKSNKASITLNIIPNGEEPIRCGVGALEPIWENFIFIDKKGTPKRGQAEVDLGGGNVKIEYAFGKIGEKSERNLWDNKTARKYYKTNMSSSGVEIRINGRILAYNLFKEIWGIEKHNSYNSFLVTIDLISNDKNSLPQTRTSKNGFRQGDEILEKLYDWIRKEQSEPVKDMALCTDERELFDEIAEEKRKHLLRYDSSAVVETEKHVYLGLGNKKEEVRVDMYEFAHNKITIYEGKVDETRGKDLYQLRMYWDGCVFDGLQPNEAILVGTSHTPAVEIILKMLNTLVDAKGNKYNFRLMTWDELC